MLMSALSQCGTNEDDKHPGSDHFQCQHRKVDLVLNVLKKTD